VRSRTGSPRRLSNSTASAWLILFVERQFLRRTTTGRSSLGIGYLIAGGADFRSGISGPGFRFFKEVADRAFSPKRIPRLKSIKEVFAKSLTHPGPFPGPGTIDTLGGVIDQGFDYCFDISTLIKSTK